MGGVACGGPVTFVLTSSFVIDDRTRAHRPALAVSGDRPGKAVLSDEAPSAPDHDLAHGIDRSLHPRHVGIDGEGLLEIVQSTLQIPLAQVDLPVTGHHTEMLRVSPEDFVAVLQRPIASPPPVIN